MYITGCIFWFIIGLVLSGWSFLNLWERFQWKMFDVDFWISIPFFLLGIYFMYLPFS